MEQTVEQRLRELLTMQIGSQVFQMCELQAQLDDAKKEIASLKAAMTLNEKAGTSEP